MNVLKQSSPGGEVALFLLVANNVVDFVNNQVVKNYGTLTVQRRETKVESWEHEPRVCIVACLPQRTHAVLCDVFLRLAGNPQNEAFMKCVCQKRC